ncbi:MAG: hypothetical protein ACLUOI_21215 [Eisenbergiella sp.]
MYREKGKERENDVETELKVAVCDDSQADRNILSQLVKKTADDMGIPVHIQGVCFGENLMEDILSEHDILSDIQMEGMTDRRLPSLSEARTGMPYWFLLPEWLSPRRKCLRSIPIVIS